MGHDGADRRRCSTRGGETPRSALTDEAWSVAVVDALIAALEQTDDPAIRAGIVANLAGLYRRYPEWSGNWFGTNPLAGEFPSKTQAREPRGDGPVSSA